MRPDYLSPGAVADLLLKSKEQWLPKGPWFPMPKMEEVR